MLLLEIFDHKQTKQGMRDVVGTLSSARKVREVGEGYYSTVFEIDHPSHLNTAMKVFRIPSRPETDAYLSFLKAFAEKQSRRENPYLPKIYKVRVFVRRAYDFYGVVTMEKLIEFEDNKNIDSAVLESQYEQMFFDMPYGGMPRAEAETEEETRKERMKSLFIIKK